jgi:hypothetical protein
MSNKEQEISMLRDFCEVYIERISTRYEIPFDTIALQFISSLHLHQGRKGPNPVVSLPQRNPHGYWIPRVIQAVKEMSGGCSIQELKKHLQKTTHQSESKIWHGIYQAIKEEQISRIGNFVSLPKRQLSEKGRKKISEAQHERWQKIREAKVTQTLVTMVNEVEEKHEAESDPKENKVV